MRRRKDLTGPDSVLGSIFNQVHTRSNSVMTVKGCPDGHSNFAGEGVWEEEDMSVEEEKNGQEKRGGRQRSRGREQASREKRRRKRLIKTERDWEWWTEATGAKMTWIHGTSIDYLRMKSQRQSSA